MKAQLVKNAVIVPTGAKGGFYPKQLPPMSNRDAWLAEGTETYRIFIRSLLSVTDNLVNDKVVHPEKVVIGDGDDPYFVVAADKGTATFSDIANEIALSRNFWLGDAFASGGSNGYDHKAMGITAKGAWISVQRHFLEMGIDVQSDPVSVAGCGDMSGDVFGNGMLLSKSIRLIAAFDHRHIFIDPNPRPGGELGRAQAAVRPAPVELGRLRPQADFERRGVFPRTEKSITLSSEAQERSGFKSKSRRSGDPDQCDPEGAGRSDVVRRHRHLHQIVVAEPGRRRRSVQRRAPRQRRRDAREGHRRRREPRHHPGRAHRIRRAWRAHQHRLHRQ